MALGKQDREYTLISKSITDGRLGLLRLYDQAKMEIIEIALDRVHPNRYCISKSSQNGGASRRLTEADVAQFGRFLPAAIVDTVGPSSMGDWFRDRLRGRLSR